MLVDQLPDAVPAIESPGIDLNPELLERLEVCATLLDLIFFGGHN
jgi:hypothetical protein